MKNNPVRTCFFGLNLLIGICVFDAGCSKAGNNISPIIPPTTDTTNNKPTLSGKLIFHSYSFYGSGDSKLYEYDLTTNKLTLLSAAWDITDPMNAHFSPDGTKIVFMGLQKGTTNWDVFLWTIGSVSQPADLTSALGSTSRDEDPKFSNSGNRIVFKHNGHLAEMDLTGTITRNITYGTGEESMPYYNYNDSLVLYAEGGGSASDIFIVKTDGTSSHTVAALAGVQEYYPIAHDSVSFFYTRWNAANNQNDQLYLGYYNTAQTPIRLPFNTADANYSDAYPYGNNYVFLSSTKAGSKGGYDLYIADIETGKIWSLSLYNANINSAKEELGAAYSSK